MPVDDRDGKTRAGEVAADLDHPRHTDRGRGLDHSLDVRREITFTGDVKVGVVVHDRDRQRVRGGWPSGMSAHADEPLLSSSPVSYTHLRAHETRHDLVCRLL